MALSELAVSMLLRDELTCARKEETINATTHSANAREDIMSEQRGVGALFYFNSLLLVFSQGGGNAMFYITLRLE